ncbi:MAG: hypothetical protein M3037_07565, partial [Gemmatimonadota bacterium]|nr:hypothetical protein [Gemmatimonadota bacterium]
MLRSFSGVLLALIAACAAPAADSVRSTLRLTAADERAIRAVDSAYVTAWLGDDTTAVLATLAPDAILMPAGQHPLAGTDAIRGFWWPVDGSHTRILTFTRQL